MTAEMNKIKKDDKADPEKCMVAYYTKLFNEEGKAKYKGIITTEELIQMANRKRLKEEEQQRKELTRNQKRRNKKKKTQSY